ncbi:unnamed protein product, partial [marine sediment metagenome]
GGVIRLVKDLSEVFVPAKNQKKACELVGVPITIEEFSVHQSRLYDSDFATVKYSTDEGDKGWLNIGSEPVLECLECIKDSLPVRCKLEKRGSEQGFDYYVLASAKVVK